MTTKTKAKPDNQKVVETQDSITVVQHVAPETEIVKVVLYEFDGIQVCQHKEVVKGSV